MTHPQFDPIALQLGPIGIRWYGLTYIIGFVLFLLLGKWRAKKVGSGWQPGELDDVLFYGVLGVILGGRLGYVLFYKPAYYFAHPLEIPAVWQGGMSFHGGLLGVLLALWFYARKTNRSFLHVGDFIGPLVPTGIASVRLGNFINGELWGRAADASVPWRMIFPQAGDGLARHPSQLYQACLEGLLLFIILWVYSSKPRALGRVSGMFLLGYGTLRFIAEFFREPDNFLGLLALNMSMGQWLCVPMIGMGLWLLMRKAQT